MGQYFKAVNLDKRQVLHPHKFDQGLKLSEWVNTGSRTLTALGLLLAGDWAGDRVAIVGDYGPIGAMGAPPGENVYDMSAGFEDVSEAAERARVEHESWRDRAMVP